MGSRYIRGDTRPVIAPVLTPQAVAVGDLTALVAGNAVRAADFTWTTDLPTTQAAFALLFLGVSGQRKDANVALVHGNGTENRIRIEAGGVYEFDCTAATFVVGDLVGPDKQTGNFLESQKVIASVTEARSIGRVVQAGTTVTKVLVEILSAKAPAARQA